MQTLYKPRCFSIPALLILVFFFSADCCKASWYLTLEANSFLQTSALQEPMRTSLLDSLNSTRININKTAMFTLGAWSLGNMALNGTLLALQSNIPAQDRTNAYYFQQMNVFWNVVNLGLAAGSLYGAFTENPQSVSLFESIEKQASIERILLLNAGLDAAYMAAGAWMLEHSKNAAERRSMWQGYGESLILQGAFLLVFDVAVYAIHHSASEPLLRQILSSTSLGLSANGSLMFRAFIRL